MPEETQAESAPKPVARPTLPVAPSAKSESAIVKLKRDHLESKKQMPASKEDAEVAEAHFAELKNRLITLVGQAVVDELTIAPAGVKSLELTAVGHSPISANLVGVVTYTVGDRSFPNLPEALIEAEKQFNSPK